jgi:hypothetical protein
MCSIHLSDLRASQILRSVVWLFGSDVSGKRLGPVFEGQAVFSDLQGSNSRRRLARPLKMGPTGYLETSARNYQSTVLKVSKERISDLHRSGSVISRTRLVFMKVAFGASCV